jgi:dTDP-4-dehydrorhamnose 3,5-epimerase
MALLPRRLCRQTSERRSGPLAASQRCHHRCAGAGDTLKAAADAEQVAACILRRPTKSARSKIVEGAGEVRPTVNVDRATVDSSGRRLATGIDGVRLRMLGPLQADHRGSLLEVIDARDPFWDEPIVYAYRFIVRPGRIKGWGMHMVQSDRYLTLAGRLRVVLFDGRVKSPTHGHYAEFQFTDETPGLLLIPPGVWHADQNTGDRDAVLINLPTRPYDHANPDKYRIDPGSGEIPFDWSLKDY